MVVLSSHVQPTVEFATNANLDLSPERMEAALREICGDAAVHALPASELAVALIGDAIAANLMLLGCAWQLGRVPVSRAALERAVALNGRSVEMNLRAIAWGRLFAHDPAAVLRAARPGLREAAHAGTATLAALLEHRTALLSAYQSPAYAERFRALVARVAEREARAQPGSDALARAVAHSYAKLLAYKDEYEVARLYSDGEFAAQVAREFEGDYRLAVHLSPQFLPGFLAPRDPETGRVKKWAIPMRVMRPAFRALAALRFLRGTPLDPFGWTRHRRMERGEIARYERTLEELLEGLSAESLPLAVEIASLPEQVRGFDSVKERQLEQALHKQAELLAAYRRA